MNGPGRALKEPLPHSTNYLGAYDRFGNLVRGGAGFQPGVKVKEAEDAPPKSVIPEGAEGEAVKAEGTPAATPEGQESADKLDAAVTRHEKEEKSTQKKEGMEEGRLPPETLEDLRPFPLNKYFRSQPVLSEELREAIYQFVMRDGHSLQLASTSFGVSNERIGAVVRLKQMEKEWIAKVRLSSFPIPRAMMKHYTFRLVFKTSTWLQHKTL
jgi:hypothetical protein